MEHPDELHLMNFLLVEDDDDHAEIMLRTIKDNRVANSMHRVADGEEALSYLRAEGEHSERLLPDIILLDLKLPKLSGHELLKIIKADPDLLAIPVVILTTSGAESDREKAYKLHANSYIVKPVNFTRFRRMVNDLSLYWGVWSPPAHT